MTEFERFKKAVQAVVSIPPEEAKRIRDKFPVKNQRALANRKKPDTVAPDHED